MPLGWDPGRDSRAGEEEPRFPPVTAGTTKDANRLNHKKPAGDVRQDEKKCVGALWNEMRPPSGYAGNTPTRRRAGPGLGY